MGVFNEYRDRPGFRTPPNEGLKLVPARIEDQSGVLKVRLLPGTSEITEDGPEPQEIAKHGNKAKKKEKEKKIPIMYAAFHDAYDKKTKQVSSPSLPKHGQKVWFKKSLRNLGVFAFWEATELKKAKPEGNDWTEGYFFCSNPNIDKKHYERVFFQEGNQQYVCDLTDEVKTQWEALIGDYQKIHEEEIRRGLTRPPVLKNEHCEWSYQVTNPTVRDLRDGMLCYAEVKLNEHRGFDVVGLYPVQISRNISPSSPFDVIANSDQKHHLPATDYEHLSPADRVFGWVSQSGGGNRPAYKGNVRIGHVECTTDDAVEEFARPGLPLAILGAPKHAQARFYLGDENGGPQQDGISRKDAAYKLGKMLRGRKVYPHQKDLERQYWAWPVRNSESCFYAQPGDERTDQNRSILGWVKPGAVFKFSIHFTNLTDVELGALLWLLDLPEGCFHRLGGGKPLGFGSVRLEIDRNNNRNWILKGSDLAAYYKSLCEAPPSGDISEKVESLKKAFEDAVRSVYGQGGNDPKFIQAFLKAAEGFDGRRTHYPRKQRRASEAIYKWFAENEKVGKRGGRKLSLPSLLDEDPSLPYDPTT
jgi:CRISPR-associated protein (TIGR03986 family)